MIFPNFKAYSATAVIGVDPPATGCLCTATCEQSTSLGKCLLSWCRGPRLRPTSAPKRHPHQPSGAPVQRGDEPNAESVCESACLCLCVQVCMFVFVCGCSCMWVCLCVWVCAVWVCALVCEYACCVCVCVLVWVCMLFLCVHAMFVYVSESTCVCVCVQKCER